MDAAGARAQRLERLALGEWLAQLGAAEFEEKLRAEGASTVQDIVDSGMTEVHLRELGMKMLLRAKVAAALAELRSSQAPGVPGLTPLEAADQRVDAARTELARAQRRLAAAESSLQHARRLTIHIVGFGTFGQFLAATFVKEGHVVVASSRSDYTELAAQLGARYCRSAEEAIEQFDPHVVVLATSIMSTAAVVKSLPTERLAGRLVVDVLSVKEFPKQLLLKHLPSAVDVLCTHPMFGPDSSRRNVEMGLRPWEDLNFQFEKVRVAAGRGQEVCTLFVEIFRSQGCKMIEMSCEEHDEHAAATQFITHTTGRMLAQLSPVSTPINTVGYESLLGLVGTTTGDSLDLYCGLFYYNANSKHQLDKLEQGLSVRPRPTHHPAPFLQG